MKKVRKLYTFGHMTVSAHNFRAANRIYRGVVRGEMDQDGRTILAKDRTPPGTPMRKRKK